MRGKKFNRLPINRQFLHVNFLNDATDDFQTLPKVCQVYMSYQVSTFQIGISHHVEILPKDHLPSECATNLRTAQSRQVYGQP